MDTGLAVLMPVIVTLLEVIVALGATLDCAVKVNGFGVVAAASVVTENVAATPPTLTVADVVAPNAAEASTFTTNV